MACWSARCAPIWCTATLPAWAPPRRPMPRPWAAGERSEERRVGKECRSRCDWSSDVCSSDLYGVLEREVRANLVYRDFTRVGAAKTPDAKTMGRWGEIGRASCRERV